MVLDAFQAGLSWAIILRKRTAMQQAFSNFDPRLVQQYGEDDRARLLADPGIIRNRLKIDATIHNAGEFIRLQDKYGSFAKFIWQFTEGTPIINCWQAESEIPAVSPQAESMSKALKKEGFKFVGPVICYAFMQAAGMINDHLTSCFRFEPLVKLAEQVTL